MIFETERLMLRQFCEDDAEALYLLNLDPEVIQYTGNTAFANISEALKFIQDYDHYTQYGFGRWAVLSKSDHSFLGWCGLKYTPASNEHDVGFRFFKNHWNKGYATESAKACLQYGFDTLHLRTIVGRTMTGNTASVKVLRKIGMTYLKPFDFNGKEGALYYIENKNA